MKFLYNVPVTIASIILGFFVTSTSGICLPCQPSNRRYTAWDGYQDLALNSTLSPRTVYNPKITNPTDTTIWVAGSQVVVTWNTSDIPNNVENPKGTLVLGYIINGSEDEHLDLHHKLASGFDVKNGYVKFNCPKVEAGSNYIVVLFGDSGNRSPKFTILH